MIGSSWLEISKPHQRQRIALSLANIFQFSQFGKRDLLKRRLFLFGSLFVAHGFVLAPLVTKGSCTTSPSIGATYLSGRPAGAQVHFIISFR
jgi:hypothetical protein